MHWCEAYDATQRYLPPAVPFVSKLAGAALRVHASTPFDLIFSFSLEPYGVAGHLVAHPVERIVPRGSVATTVPVDDARAGVH